MENIEDKNMNLVEKLLIFFIILFKYLITYGVSKKFLSVYLFILIVVALVDLFRKKVYLKEIKSILIFGIISIYFVLFYFEQNFVISFILALICLRRNDREFIKIFFISSTACFLFSLLLDSINVTNSGKMIRIVDGVTNIRYNLGFTHPNEVFLFFLPIVLSGFYLFSKNEAFYIVTIIAATILYEITDCRTGFYVIILFFILVLLRKLFKNKYIKKIIPIAFLLFTIFSILLAVFFGDNRTNIVSSLLSGRPFFWDYYIENGKMFTFLGDNLVKNMFLDNFYLYLLVQLGIIGYLIYFVIYYSSLKKLSNNYKYLIIATVFLIYGLFEANVIIGSIQFLFAIQIKSIIENKLDEKEKLN